MSEDKVHALAKVFNNDLDLVLFFLKWIQVGQNGVKAYQELHPDTDYGTAATLASRMLKKVDIQLILETYGLGLEKYMDQLKQGIEAEKRDQFSGEISPDHSTRKPYHDKLGKMLGVEKEGGGVAIQVNNQFVSLNDFFSRIDKRVAEDDEGSIN